MIKFKSLTVIKKTQPPRSKSYFLNQKIESVSERVERVDLDLNYLNCFL